MEIQKSFGINTFTVFKLILILLASLNLVTSKYASDFGKKNEKLIDKVLNLKRDLTNLTEKAQNVSEEIKKLSKAHQKPDISNIMMHVTEYKSLKNTLKSIKNDTLREECEKVFEEKFDQVTTHIWKIIMNVFDSQVEILKFLIELMIDKKNFIEHDLNYNAGQLIDDCNKNSNECKILLEYRKFVDENLLLLETERVNPVEGKKFQSSLIEMANTAISNSLVPMVKVCSSGRKNKL